MSLHNPLTAEGVRSIMGAPSDYYMQQMALDKSRPLGRSEWWTGYTDYLRHNPKVIVEAVRDWVEIRTSAYQEFFPDVDKGDMNILSRFHETEVSPLRPLVRGVGTNSITSSSYGRIAMYDTVARRMLMDMNMLDSTQGCDAWNEELVSIKMDYEIKRVDLVLNCLFNTPSYYQPPEKRYAFQQIPVTASQAFDAIHASSFLLSKHNLGEVQVVQEMQQVFSQTKKKIAAIILPLDSVAHVNCMDTYKTSYSKSGPDAVESRTADTFAMFGGVPVLPLPVQATQYVQDHEFKLTRPVMSGSISDFIETCDDFKQYSTRCRRIRFASCSTNGLNSYDLIDALLHAPGWIPLTAETDAGKIDTDFLEKMTNNASDLFKTKLRTELTDNEHMIHPLIKYDKSLSKPYTIVETFGDLDEKVCKNEYLKDVATTMVKVLYPQGYTKLVEFQNLSVFIHDGSTRNNIDAKLREGISKAATTRTEFKHRHIFLADPESVALAVLLVTPITLQVLVNFAQYNIAIPFNANMMRLSESQYADSAIGLADCKGANYKVGKQSIIEKSDVVSFDPITQVITYDMRSKLMIGIEDDAAFLVKHNIRGGAYIGGSGHMFINQGSNVPLHKMLREISCIEEFRCVELGDRCIIATVGSYNSARQPTQNKHFSIHNTYRREHFLGIMDTSADFMVLNRHINLEGSPVLNEIFKWTHEEDKISNESLDFHKMSVLGNRNRHLHFRTTDHYSKSGWIRRHGEGPWGKHDAEKCKTKQTSQCYVIGD